MKKIILSILMLFFCLNACSNKNDIYNGKLILPKMICKSDCFNFDLSDSIVYEKLKNQQMLSEYKINDSIKKLISSKIENYEDLYYYCRLEIKDSEIFIFYGDSDYYKDFLLITFLDNKIIDVKIISSILGDGDYFYFKKSIFKDDIFYSKFTEGNRTFTIPDTIYYKSKGLSQIKVHSSKKINEDTIQNKVNFKEIVNSLDYKIEDNY